MRRPHPSVSALVLSLGLMGPGVARGQEPPSPVPRPPIAIPTVTEVVLANGLELLVISDRDTPFVTVDVFVRGGQRADPPGLTGLSRIVAGALTRGTANRSAREITDSVDALGATLSTAASSDWISVSLGVLSPYLDEGLGLLADVVVNPTFSVLEVERVKGQALASIGGGWSDPARTATRVLAGAVYGEHPYGGRGSIEGIGAALVTAVRRQHATLFRPENLLVVVGGDVDASTAKSLIESHFGGWTPSGRPDASVPPSPPEPSPGVILVHRPGATQATIAIGHSLPGAAEADWTALSVANQLLGGPRGRLQARFAEREGWGGSVFSSVSHRVGKGLLQLRADVRAEVADSAIGIMLEELASIGDQPPPIKELRRIPTLLLRSLPLQRETARQIGNQAAGFRMLGLPLTEWLETSDRVLALDPESVRASADRYFHPERAVVVVVGDATLLRPRLAGIGPLRIEDIAGEALTLADLAPPSVEVDWNTDALRPGSWTYRITAEGRPMGSLTRTLEREEGSGEGIFTLRSSMNAGPQTLDQEVRFLATSFVPLSSSFELSSGGSSIVAELEVDGERVRGRRVLAIGQEEPFEVTAAPGALLGEMLELALWVLPLEEGLTLTLPVMQVQSGAVARVTIRVLRRVRSNVPAGSFETFMVEIAGEQGTQVAYAQVRAPHVVVRLESIGQPLVLELESVSNRVPD